VTGRRRTQDHYGRRAKRERYPARSVYKLQEIDEKTRLVRKNDKVVDLGASPGSWTRYASEKVGPGGLVVAVDRQPLGIGEPPNVLFMEADVLELDIAELETLLKDDRKIDLVISDMAPHTSGHRFVDQARSFNLFSRALEIAAQLLRPGGRFAGKIFQGEDFETARDNVRALFNQTKIIKPKSVRQQSYEIYLVGLNKR
jgi:23S rRNA (uridine2552-2'-O)-methyltransferase